VATLIEGDLPIGESEQGPIPARAHILTGDEFRSTLTDKNAAGCHKLTAKSFHAQPLADAVAPVTDAALTFLCAIKLDNYALIALILTTVSS